MLYYLFEYLSELGVTGTRLFQFLSFRASLAMVIALIVTIVFGNKFITYLQRLQVKDKIRDLGLDGEKLKVGTPTMGGVIILAAILIPILLLTKLDNIYILLLLLVTIWMGLIGFLDDYIKVFKKDKGGLRARSKLLGQVGLGLIVGTVMYFHQDVVIREDITDVPNLEVKNEVFRGEVEKDGATKLIVDYKAPVTNLPFLKSHIFDYAKPLSFLGEGYEKWAWIIYIFASIFIITAVSNAANLTDGIDGLATGLSAIAGGCLGIFAYVSGNAIFAEYLDILYLPNIGELVVFAGAFVGACIGFLWYNAFPAQVFMGDTGSLTLGGIIAVFAIAVRKELLIPLLCGIFLVENLSVMIQVGYFKYTKRKYGEGRRVFLMSPLHHHYQKLGVSEPKIVTRFWIVGIILAILTFVTLKLR